MGHPGLPDLGTVDGTPMKYTHNTIHDPCFFAYYEFFVSDTNKNILIGFTSYASTSWTGYATLDVSLTILRNPNASQT
jgi:hypothetical protein